MKKGYIILLILAAAIVIVAVFAFRPTQPAAEPPARLTVAATVFPLADITERIVGEHAAVVNLVPPGASPHTFEVTPADIKKLQDVEIIFAIGAPLDAWTSNIVSATGAEVSVADSGIEKIEFQFEHEDEEAHEERALDPHYWLSMENAKIIAGNIARKLGEIDPANVDTYQANSIAYQAELDQAKAQIDAELAGLPARDLIVFHESFNYFAREFGLNILGVFETSPGKEPTPQYLAELYKTASERQTKSVFSEPQLSPETISPFVEDLGLTLYVLDPIGGTGERDSYINTQLYNAQTIKQALGE